MLELQLHKKFILRHKLHLSFLEMNLLHKKNFEEENFDIFYQLLAGLSEAERYKFHIFKMGPEDFAFLNYDKRRARSEEDISNFHQWKTNVEKIGLNYNDIVRVLVAVLMIGNLSLESDNEHWQKVSDILCVRKGPMKDTMTTKTKRINGELNKIKIDLQAFESRKRILATSLFIRTVSSMVRKINSLKTEDSFKSQKQETDPISFFIVDSVGLQRSNCGFERLCMNLWTETLQVIRFVLIATNMRLMRCLR